MNREQNLSGQLAELYNHQFNGEVNKLLRPIYEKFKGSIDEKAMSHARNVVGHLVGEHVPYARLGEPYFEFRSRMTFDEALGYGLVDPRYYGPFLDVSFQHFNNQASIHTIEDALFNTVLETMNKSSRGDYIKHFTPEVIQFAREIGFPVTVFADNFENEIVVGDVDLKKDPRKREYHVLAVREWDNDSNSLKLVK